MTPTPIDELARRAAQAVRDRADQMERHRPDHSDVRRRDRVRRRAAAGMVVALVVAGLAVFAESRPASIPVIGDGARQTENDAVPNYELDHEDAVLVREETSQASTSDVALWHRPATGEYLSLAVRPGLGEGQPEPAGFGPVSAVRSMDPGMGQAWVTDDDGGPPAQRSIAMWWTRPNDDVWLLRAHWYGEAEPSHGQRASHLVEWARSIQRPSEGSIELAMPGFDLVAFDRSSTFTSKAKVWRFRDEEITLLVLGSGVAGGRSNLLVVGPPEPTTVDGQTAWLVRDASGEVSVGWSTGQSGSRWVVLTIPSGLSDSVETILKSLSS